VVAEAAAGTIRVACAIMFRESQELKLAIIDDAERLDDESWRIIEEMANHRGWQVFGAFVANSDLAYEISA
jgi:hypothetical protein